jgi:hypothetical protein
MLFQGPARFLIVVRNPAGAMFHILMGGSLRLDRPCSAAQKAWEIKNDGIRSNVRQGQCTSFR